MWPRIVELMLGMWLLASPFIFRHSDAEAGFWRTDLTTGFAVIVLSFLSYSKRFGAAHLVTAVVGLFLIAYGYLAPDPRPAAAQNEIIIGLLLAMTAIIPNRADELESTETPALPEESRIRTARR